MEDVLKVQAPNRDLTVARTGLLFRRPVAAVRVWREGDLKLLKLTNKVHDMLQITELNTVIDIMDDEAVAIESFGRAMAAAG